MNCPKCGFENPDGAKFCNECGSVMEAECPECGKRNPPGSKFCNECGYDLKKPKRAPVIDYDEPQSYTPKHLADKILSNRTALEGERKLVTILFADVAGSTAMFEKLDPEAVHEIMDGCFRILMDEIHRYEGTVNQFRGDGLMALFGAPIAHEDHAQRACYAALAIQKALIPYRQRLDERYGIDFTMRIGLNSGPVVVGAIGDDLRMDYTAQGDTANLAARMESNAEPGGVLVSKYTHRLAREFFEFEPVGAIQVKGKEAPIECCKLMKRSEVETRIAASAARGLTKFVGRRGEIGTLLETFEKARSGVGQVVGIVGEAGVGKSRLVLELRKRLELEDHTFLEAHCLHYGGSMPYLPIIEILRSYFDVKETEREFAIKTQMEEKILELDRNLSPVLPAVQELLSLKVEDAKFTRLDPLKKREATFEGIRNLFIRESQRKPLVLVIDDLQWIDKTSEDLLDYLIGWLPRTHILLIVLYRPEYVHSWASKSYYTNVYVDQLPADTSTELVQSILESSSIAPELVELILSRTSGNPLFVEELTRSLLENGSIQKRENRFILSRSASEIQVPSSIQGIIAARMDRLEETLKRLLQVASVIGRDFAFRILQAITGMRKELKSCLLNLQGLEFIYEKALFPELEYIFKHALTQEVAYNSLLLKSRLEIHEKIARAIEALYADRLEEFYGMLAYHYDKSNNLEKAIEYWRLAARRSLRMYAVNEAIEYLAGAREKIRKLPEGEDRNALVLDVGTKLGFAYLLRNMYPKALSVVRPLEKLVVAENDPKTLGRMYTILGICQAAHEVNLDGGIQSLKRALKLSQETNDIPTMSFSATYLGWAYMFSGELHSAQAPLRTVIGPLEEKRSWYTLSVPFSFMAWRAIHFGDRGSAESWSSKSYELAEKLDEPFTRSWANMVRGWLSLEKGDMEKAKQHLAIAYENARKISLHGTMEESLLHRIRLHLRTREYDVAAGHAREFADLIDAGGFYAYKCASLALQAEIDLHDKDFEACRRNLENAETFNVPLYEGYLYRLWGQFYGMAEPADHNSAVSWTRKAIETHEKIGMRLELGRDLVSLGEILGKKGAVDEASESYKRALSIFEDFGSERDVGLIREATNALTSH